MVNPENDWSDVFAVHTKPFLWFLSLITTIVHRRGSQTFQVDDRTCYFQYFRTAGGPHVGPVHRSWYWSLWSNGSKEPAAGTFAK